MGEDKSGAIKHVLVVGGGTAGWLSACHLAKKLNSNLPDGIKVTLVESPEIPTIGVGEGTVPAIRNTLEYLGISESDFVRECDVTFKQSIKFVDWLDKPGTATDNYYHHIFDYPAISDVDLTPYWLMGQAGEVPYVDAVAVQGQVCDGGFGPKLMTHPEYQGATNYAYHLDAAKMARFLTQHATEKLGVNHILATVTDVQMASDGNIAAIDTKEVGVLSADLFVDCTGFAALMIGQKLGVEFISKSDVLFVDHALAVQVPYVNADDPIPCYTISTAKEAGWIWDIGLSERRGTGYVYSSKHTSHERAEEVMRSYLRETIGSAADDVMCRRIPMQIGYREKFWVKNCVSIGLSQGFVEPLEATGLLVFDATARMLADLFPPSLETMPAIAARFNDRVKFAWDRVIDFIKLHYCLSKRDDSEFWRDNCDPVTIPQTLLDNLALWKHQPPSSYDFSSKLEIFNLENYLYVLYGMKFETEMGPIAYRYKDSELAQAAFRALRQDTEQMASGLLPHRELIDRIKKYGMQRI